MDFLWFLVGLAVGVEMGRLNAGRKMDWTKALIALGIAAFLAAAVVCVRYWWSTRDGGWWDMMPHETGVYCTQEARQCPDGSFVGRTGPHCEFAPCPTPQ